MLKLAYIGGLGMMSGPAATHLSPASAAQVLRVHDRGHAGGQRDSYRSAWREHGAQLVGSFEQLVGEGEIDGVVICAGKNGDDLPLVAQLGILLQQRCSSPAFILHLSTVSPAFVKAAVDYCSGIGVAYINYPLTGGPLGAQLGGASNSGMLILASGPEPLYQRLLPTLQLLGRPRYFGEDIAAGCITKLIGHHLVYNGLIGISSGAALHTAQLNAGKLGGETQADYLGFLNGGAGGTRQWDVALKKGIAEGNWSAGFNIRHAVVDAVYAAQLAIDSGLPRFATQSIINIAFVFAYVLEQYPEQSLATHSLVREMIGDRVDGLDRFMQQRGAYAEESTRALAAAIEVLPEAVRKSVCLSPAVDDFVAAAK